MRRGSRPGGKPRPGSMACSGAPPPLRRTLGRTTPPRVSRRYEPACAAGAPGRPPHGEALEERRDVQETPSSSETTATASRPRPGPVARPRDVHDRPGSGQTVFVELMEVIGRTTTRRSSPPRNGAEVEARGSGKWCSITPRISGTPSEPSGADARGAVEFRRITRGWDPEISDDGSGGGAPSARPEPAALRREVLRCARPARSCRSTSSSP
jgi:hypothetical protein